MYRVQSYAVRHKGESGLTAVARLVLVTPLTGPEVVMMKCTMPIRIDTVTRTASRRNSLISSCYYRSDTRFAGVE